ncbi:hypothetical protein [Solidesulfovibrio alcoholivorans]|uniref:hypothetical protein n=1 Tax=Solidesulfovibrio alcoholivorans TaxID=81406 RepID=UPI0012EBA226|nr:hypothetical protein [Solidesulfovibrio alcoholivorans]
MNAFFLYEKDMTLFAEQWVHAQGLFCKKEFSLPWGVCDVVGCSFRCESVQKRLLYGQRKSLGPQLRVMLFMSIPEKDTGTSIDKESLYQKFSLVLDRSKFESDLSFLEKNKFIISMNNECFQRINGWYPLHDRLIAVELKIKRFSEALRQAEANLRFADESYVGLPLDAARKVCDSGLKEQFFSSGVGLLGFGRVSCDVVIKPQISKKINIALQDHCIERFWRTFSKACQH